MQLDSKGFVSIESMPFRAVLPEAAETDTMPLLVQIGAVPVPGPSD
jgi:hypothetical protein